MDKKCPECKSPIFGRSDKKFCSDLCRNTYNNKQNAASTNLIRNTNHALKKNYLILESICKEDKAKTTRSNLLERGFDFSLITSIRITKKGSMYCFLYDYGYLELNNDYFLIVKDLRGKEFETDKAEHFQTNS
jgi:predicted nucleic acid-binding Zn ribbon protein